MTLDPKLKVTAKWSSEGSDEERAAAKVRRKAEYEAVSREYRRMKGPKVDPKAEKILREWGLPGVAPDLTMADVEKYAAEAKNPNSWWFAPFHVKQEDPK